MVNKRGYLRILEAVIAVVLLFGVILFVTSRQQTLSTEIPSNVLESQGIILEEISINEILRGCVLNYVDNSDLNNEGNCLDMQDSACWSNIEILIGNNIPVGYNYECEICEKSLSCGSFNIPVEKSVYTSAVFFGGDGSNEKVIRLYFWK